MIEIDSVKSKVREHIISSSAFARRVPTFKDQDYRNSRFLSRTLKCAQADLHFGKDLFIGLLVDPLAKVDVIEHGRSYGESSNYMGDMDFRYHRAGGSVAGLRKQSP